MTNVHLGYQVGTGEPVEVPIAHMVITGQTQLSGKTTTLEALATRASGMRALAFRTKRGEGAFGGDGRALTVPPYFRERADWKFVSSVLEAEIGERMKFERGWIMKACRGARALVDVRKNVTKLMTKAREGLSKDVYMMLGEYLDAVIPVLDRVKFSDRVYLRQGISVVDLTAVPLNVQGLVISSMLSWVHEHERDVTVILPESWKFIPQGRNSPVRMAAVSLAREGAGIKNFIWLDSQDLAGTEKEIVRAASVYLLGVQREANEIKRTLAHIPAGIKKPRAEDIATLERGHFFACWGVHAVRTYVQPAWLDDAAARGVAMGDVATIPDPPRPDPSPRVVRSYSRPATLETIDRQVPTLERDIAVAIMGPRLAAQMEKYPARPAPPPADPRVVRALRDLVARPEEDEMNPKQEEKLDRLIDAVDALVNRTASAVTMVEKEVLGVPGKPRPLTRDQDPVGVLDEDAFVERVIARLKDRAPLLLKVMATRPEIDVVVQRQTIEVDGKTLRGRLARMIADGKFDDGINGKEATRQLNAAGYGVAHPSVYAELDNLAEMEFLTLEKAPDKTRLYRATKDAKVNVVRK